MKFTIDPVLTSPLPTPRSARFTITALDQGDDENPADNSAEATFEVMEKAFRRTVLVEEFTTEKCPNCPAAAIKLHSVLSNPAYSDRVVAVCHHVGYYTDWLTIPESEPYMWFYNASGTYAPAMMADRESTEEPNTPVFFPSSESQLKGIFDARLAEPSPVSVTVSSSVDGKNVAVSVIGERVADTCEDTRLTVYLVENDVVAANQAGGGQDYIHQHVLRAVNTTWGDPIDWTGDTFSREYSFELKDRWNAANMQVVAFVSRYDAEDPLKCGVENAAVLPLGSSGIDAVADSAERVPVAYFGIDGTKYSTRPEKGIFITLFSDGTTSKNFVY